MAWKDQRYSLMSSAARIQVPWIKVNIGIYTFGVFSRRASDKNAKDEYGNYYTTYNVQYPNYVQSLEITKINGQFNQYTLTLVYPVTVNDDPNFMDKVLSSVSKTRKIILSYGDMSMPSYIYKNEEAIITKVQKQINIQTSVITFIINAVSSASLNTGGSFTFPGGKIKPSDRIKSIFNNKKYKLQSLFTGMNSTNLNLLIEGDDMEVNVVTKTNISAIDYIRYLVSCMTPASGTISQSTKSDLYVLTMHDDAVYEESSVQDLEIRGPYFRVERVSKTKEHSDAFEIDIGVGNTGTIVTAFSITDNQNYSLLYDYNKRMDEQNYVRRIDSNGQMQEIYSPAMFSKTSDHLARTEDLNWWTQVTQYPIKASITVQGLLRPAVLMSYIRINIIFPGGHKYMDSGLYLVTNQVDRVDGQNGYKTTLTLLRVGGDTDPNL